MAEPIPFDELMSPAHLISETFSQCMRSYLALDGRGQRGIRLVGVMKKERSDGAYFESLGEN
jgi:hypothetical protein